jgi:hypothetical protein
MEKRILEIKNINQVNRQSKRRKKITLKMDGVIQKKHHNGRKYHNPDNLLRARTIITSRNITTTSKSPPI